MLHSKQQLYSIGNAKWVLCFKDAWLNPQIHPHFPQWKWEESSYFSDSRTCSGLNSRAQVYFI